MTLKSLLTLRIATFDFEKQKTEDRNRNRKQKQKQKQKTENRDPEYFPPAGGHFELSPFLRYL